MSVWAKYELVQVGRGPRHSFEDRDRDGRTVVPQHRAFFTAMGGEK